nr:unnamed protein product [Digitaria exilis]
MRGAIRQEAAARRTPRPQDPPNPSPPRLSSSSGPPLPPARPAHGREAVVAASSGISADREWSALLVSSRLVPSWLRVLGRGRRFLACWCFAAARRVCVTGAVGGGAGPGRNRIRNF